MDFLKSLVGSSFCYIDSKFIESNKSLESIETLFKEKASIHELDKDGFLPPLISTNKKKQKSENRTKSSGNGWFDLKSFEKTNEIENELKLLHLRNYIQPGRFYKKAPKKFKMPDFFQIGEVISHPSEFYSNRGKKQSLTKLIQKETQTKNKINERFKLIQSRKKKKSYYKKLNYRKSLNRKKSQAAFKE